MKKRTMLLCAVTLALPMTAMARVDVHVNIGVPVPVVPVPPPPPQVVIPPPPPMLFERPPVFLAPPALGFYVGVDVPYDIYFTNNYYYLSYRNVWYRSLGYNGPWVTVQREYLPQIIRRRRVENIRVYRDREFQRYRLERDHYRGKPFMPPRPEGRPGMPPRPMDRGIPGPGHMERRDAIREDVRRDRRELKEERKMDRKMMKEDHKRDKNMMKQERKFDKDKMKDFRR